jgi:large subunit ribosomal protein L6
MSRIGKQPITIPAGVTVTITPELITVTGPKGSLTQATLAGLGIKQEDSQLIIERQNELQQTRGWHGLLRTLVSNMIIGVSEGFSRQLELNGVGYRAALAGTNLQMNLGFSHQVTYKLPEGVSAKIEQNIITISGISKQQVGQVAAEIRALKKPEPYKGKGFKYVGEHIIRKSGKSGKEKA